MLLVWILSDIRHLFSSHVISAIQYKKTGKDMSNLIETGFQNINNSASQIVAEWQSKFRREIHRRRAVETPCLILRIFPCAWHEATYPKRVHEADYNCSFLLTPKG